MDPSTWPECIESPDCHGVQAPGYDRCVAHMSDTEKTLWLSSISAGVDLDVRGVSLDAALLQAILSNAADAVTRVPTFHDAHFEFATFTGVANFANVKFQEAANFSNSEFRSYALFNKAEFTRRATFQAAHFSDKAQFQHCDFAGGVDFSRTKWENITWFDGAQFSELTSFENAHFGNTSWFVESVFTDRVHFQKCTFASAIFMRTRFQDGGWFQECHFSGTATFHEATFDNTSGFTQCKFLQSGSFHEAQFANDLYVYNTEFCDVGEFSRAVFNRSFHARVVCGKELRLTDANFARGLRIYVAAGAINCNRATFAGSVTFHARYSRINLEDVSTEQPLSITSYPSRIASGVTGTPYTHLDEHLLNSSDPKAKVVNLRGVDAANLVLSDVDLTECKFTGVYHLDQIRLEGNCTFSTPPSGIFYGWSVLPVWRWTTRRTLLVS